MPIDEMILSNLRQKNANNMRLIDEYQMTFELIRLIEERGPRISMSVGYNGKYYTYENSEVIAKIKQAFIDYADMLEAQIEIME